MTPDVFQMTAVVRADGLAARKPREPADILKGGKSGSLPYQQLQYDASVKFYTFEIVIEKEDENAGYLAYSPTLPGCFSNGKTIEETRRSMREAIQQHIAALLSHGEPVPQNEKVVHVEELTVGIP